MAEPHRPARPDRDVPSPVDPARLARDVAEVDAVTAIGVEVDGEVQIAEHLWAIYGHTTYDSGLVVAEYTDVVEATAVLRAVGHDHDESHEASP